jgi:hypothetical protein
VPHESTATPLISVDASDKAGRQEDDQGQKRDIYRQDASFPQDLKDVAHFIPSGRFLTEEIVDTRIAIPFFFEC